MSTATFTDFVGEVLQVARPAGFHELRATAEAALEGQELPTTRHEDWRYCDLSPLKALSFQAGDPAQVDIRERIHTEAKGSRLVFVNGHYDPHHSCVEGLPEGVVLSTLSTPSACSKAEPQLGESVFERLNAARFQDGACICVPQGVKVEVPLHLLFITRAEDGAPLVTHPRVHIRAERFAELQVMEEYVGEGAYFTNAVVEILLGEEAKLQHDRIQRESEQAFHISHLSATLQRGARYLSNTVNLGARLSRQNPQVFQAGEGIEAVLNGLTLIGGTQLSDTHSIMDHALPHGQSQQINKCIVDEKAVAIFNGKVYVRPGAQKTNAQQSSRNLLLSKDARVDTKPQLEIAADDVKCAHGAAVGQLDPDELFYIQSRGLNLEAARNLLTYAFAADIIKRIPVPSLRRQLRDAVMARTHSERELEELA